MHCVHVSLARSAPVTALACQLQASHALYAKIHDGGAGRVLAEIRLVEALGRLQLSGVLPDEPRKTWAADLLFALNDEDHVDRDLVPRSLNGLQGVQKPDYAALAVGGAPPDYGGAVSRQINDLGIERRDYPARLARRLHIVELVEDDGLVCSRVQTAIDYGVFVCFYYGALGAQGTNLVGQQQRHLLDPPVVRAHTGLTYESLYFADVPIEIPVYLSQLPGYLSGQRLGGRPM